MAHYRQGTANAMDALVSSEQIRFENTSVTLCTDRRVPDEIRWRVRIRITEVPTVKITLQIRRGRYSCIRNESRE